MTAANRPARGRPVSVVVGVGGGIGAALAAALARRDPEALLVGLGRRRPENWADDRDRMFLMMDLADETTIAAAARTIADVGTTRRVLVATGLLHGDGVTPERSLRALDPEALARLFAVNAIGPAMVAKHLAPLMSREEPAVFAALSARVGSISDNRLGGWYGYRASKAALNMLVATLAVEMARTHPLAACVALHPGTVDTRLSAPFRPGACSPPRLSPQQCAADLLTVLDGLGPQDSGRFLARDGSDIPW